MTEPLLCTGQHFRRVESGDNSGEPLPNSVRLSMHQMCSDRRRQLKLQLALSRAAFYCTRQRIKTAWLESLSGKLNIMTVTSNPYNPKAQVHPKAKTSEGLRSAAQAHSTDSALKHLDKCGGEHRQGCADGSQTQASLRRVQGLGLPRLEGLRCSSASMALVQLRPLPEALHPNHENLVNATAPFGVKVGITQTEGGGNAKL